MELQDVIKDLKAQIHRAKNSTYLEAKKELADNVYPSMIALAESVDETLTDFYAELQEDNLIQLPLAAQILATLDLGDQLVSAVTELQQLDDLARKRLSEITDAWKKAAAITRENVGAATVEGDDGEEDDEGEDDGEEEEEGA